MTNDNISLPHATHADGQHYCRRDRKGLRHCRDSECDCDEEDGRRIAAAEEFGQSDDDDQGENNATQLTAELLHSAHQRRLCRRPVQSFGHTPHFTAQARCGHQTTPPTAKYRCPGKQHVAPLAQHGLRWHGLIGQLLHG